MENENPAAQGQPTDAGSPAQTATGDEKSGTQKRFDELTYQARESQRQLAETQSAMLQMAQQVADLTSRLAQAQAPTAPQEPAIEVDPEQEKVVSHVARKYVAPELKAITEALRQTQAELAALRGDAVTQRMNGLQIPTDVMAEAKKMVASGFSAGPQALENAVDLVLGRRARQQQERTLAGQSARARTNVNPSGTNTLPFGSAAPPQGTPEARPLPELPTDFPNLKPAEQMKLLKERGVLDKAI